MFVNYITKSVRSMGCGRFWLWQELISLFIAFDHGLEGG